MPLALATDPHTTRGSRAPDQALIGARVRVIPIGLTGVGAGSVRARRTDSYERSDRFPRGTLPGTFPRVIVLTVRRIGVAMTVGAVCLLLSCCSPGATRVSSTKRPIPSSTTNPTGSALVPGRPGALAVGPNGNLYIADEMRNQILERLSDGTFSVVAGTGKAGFSGDRGPAVDAEIHFPTGMAFGPDGTLYFTDQANERIRAILPGGTINTIVGDGKPNLTSGFVTNPTPALNASVTPYDVNVSPGGRLYVATGEQVLRLDADGTLAPVVGIDSMSQGVYGIGGPAVDGSADGVDGIAFDKAGNLYLFGLNTKTLLMVTTSGILTEPRGNPRSLSQGKWGAGDRARWLSDRYERAIGRPVVSHGYKDHRFVLPTDIPWSSEASHPMESPSDSTGRSTSTPTTETGTRTEPPLLPLAPMARPRRFSGKRREPTSPAR